MIGVKRQDAGEGSFSIQKFMLQILNLYTERGVKGRLEFSRKFILFGGVTRPFVGVGVFWQTIVPFLRYFAIRWSKIKPLKHLEFLSS